ncbi:MAG: SUMF1/EgtB/PvdO family nonheme iron enzyme, partial [Phycisphaerae bacterium]|nr:SUMF1/EgtB/PvdO family nonheme iron enzyme [Saprospiraceae bacterium]
LFLQEEKDGHFFTNCNSGPIRTPEEVTVIGFQSDGFLYTAPVKSFQPNEAGLYQMAGNVAEWTSDNYSTISDPYRVLLDELEDGKNPNPKFLNRIKSLVPAEPYRNHKIIKGGSWVDGPFYMQSGVVKVQNPNKATCTTGFRPALVIEKK